MYARGRLFALDERKHEIDSKTGLARVTDATPWMDHWCIGPEYGTRPELLLAWYMNHKTGGIESASFVASDIQKTSTSLENSQRRPSKRIYTP
jgi:hypothetical protein